MATKTDKTANSDKGEIILYRSPDGKAALDVRLKGETLWLNVTQTPCVRVVVTSGVQRSAPDEPAPRGGLIRGWRP